MYKAEILADSLSPQGHRLTTMKVTFPRIVLAEFNTHRMFSRNSASSRAIPFNKMVQMVEENPFIPIAWQKDHKGMQGTEYFDQINIKENVDATVLKGDWLIAKAYAVKSAKMLHSRGVTKQLCNRLLEPFMWHTVIVTSSEEGLENFFKLRCPQYHTPVSGEGFYFRSKRDCIANHSNSDNISKLENMTNVEWLQINKSQAEIHIQAIAELMWDAYNESVPKQLQPGEWHIPFGDGLIADVTMFSKDKSEQARLLGKDLTSEFIKIATARCARISYETLGDNPKIDYEADLRLYDRLLAEGHMSPFEHCARVMGPEYYYSSINGYLLNTDFEITNGKVVDYEHSSTLTKNLGWCRNFRGFIQHRYKIETLKRISENGEE